MVWNDNVANSVLRHVGTAGGTALGIMATLGVLSPENAASAVNALHQTMEGFQQAFGGVSQLLLILGPAFAALMAGLAGTSATLKSQLKSITANKVVEVNGTIVVPPDVAKAVPSPQVVPASKASQ